MPLVPLPFTLQLPTAGESPVVIDSPHSGMDWPADFAPSASREAILTTWDAYVEELWADAPQFGASLLSARFPRAYVDVNRSRDDIDPAMLIFEITESRAIEDIVGVQALLHKLRELGCKIAVDDFGTGFSTFAYLRQLEADYLKIDGSIIRGLPDDPLDRTVIAALTSIAEIAGKRTIAEWVEDPKMLVALYECGVDYAQGYAVAHPRLQLMPQRTFEASLTDDPPVLRSGTEG